MRKPSKKDIEIFTKLHDSLTVQACRSLVEYGKAMIQVMNETGVSDDFDFKGMAITSVKNRLKYVMDELDRLQFENDEIGVIIEEITRPKGS